MNVASQSFLIVISSSGQGEEGSPESMTTAQVITFALLREDG